MSNPPLNSGQAPSLHLPEGAIPCRPPSAGSFEDYFDFVLFCLETFPPSQPIPSGPRVPFQLNPD